MKRVLVMILALIVCLNVIFVFDYNVFASDAIESNNWKDKIDEEIYLIAKVQETIPVYVWYEDVEQDVIESKVKQITGITKDSLQTISESFDRKLVDELQKVAEMTQQTLCNKEISEEMKEYFAQTEISRALERIKTNRYINKRREIAKKMYQEVSKQLREAFIA